MGRKRSDVNRAFLRKIDDKPKRCKVCGKALRKENKSSLCNKHLNELKNKNG